MLSIHLIERQFHASRLERLIDSVSANGLDLPLPLRVRLSQHPACAIGLGLRRLVELTHGPTTLSREMTRRLLDSQDADGSCGQDPLATACAASAMEQVLTDHAPRATGGAGRPGGRMGLADAGRLTMSPDEIAELSLARERALAALAAMQLREDGACGFRSSTERSAEDHALVAAFILYLLAHDADFRGAVGFAELMDWFEQRHDSLDADTDQLWRLARTDGAPGGPGGPAGHPVPPGPCVAAIAA